MMAQWRAIDAVMPRPAGARVSRSCRRPTSPTAGRTTRRWSSAPSHHCPDPREVVDDLRRRPADAVGRRAAVWEKLKAALEAGSRRSPTRSAQAFEGALGVGVRRSRAEQAGEPCPRARRRGARRTSWCSAGCATLGLDAAELLVVGAAPTPPEVLEFFHALGIPFASLGDVGACGVAR